MLPPVFHRRTAAGVCMVLAICTTTGALAGSLTATLSPFTNNQPVAATVTVTDLPGEGGGVKFDLDLFTTADATNSDPGTITGVGLDLLFPSDLELSDLAFTDFSPSAAVLVDASNNVSFNGGSNTVSFEFLRSVQDSEGPGNGARIFRNLTTLGFHLNLAQSSDPSTDSASITTEAFLGQAFGIRVQQINADGRGEEGSASLTGTFAHVVPSPAGVGVGCVGAAGLLLRRRRETRR